MDNPLMDDNLILMTSRPTRADAVKNRVLLLETAQRLFAEHGVDAVTMSDVAEAAGVGKGTLYRHFANKIELCQVIIDEDQRDLQNRTLARLRTGGSPRENLEWFLREVVAFVSRNQAFVFSASGLISNIDHPAHVWWRQTIRGLLLRIQPSLDADYLADVFFVMLNPRTIHYQINARGSNFEQVADSLVSLFRRATT